MHCPYTATAQTLYVRYYDVLCTICNALCTIVMLNLCTKQIVFFFAE